MLARARTLLTGDGLAARARRGTLLTIAGFGFGNLFRLVSNLILTRLLFPEAFGLMALVQVIMSGLQMISDVGLRASIIQHARGDDPDFINTAWTLQVIRGVVISAAIVVLAPYAADFYDEPQLAAVLPIAGLGAILNGLLTTRVITAERNVTLGRVTLVGIFEQIVILTITALLAWWLQTVWAIVYGNLIGAALRNISSRLFLPGEPNRFRLEKHAVRDLIGFGKFILISTLATFLVNNGDRAILGKFVTLDILGLYGIAMALATLPVTLIRRLDMSVIFPIYSRRPPHENDADRQRIFRARYLLTGAAFAACVVLVLVGDPFVRFLYDPRYHDAGVITVLAVIGTMPPIVIANYESILLANSRSDVYALLISASAAIRIAVLYFGISAYGVVGAALAPAVATALYYPVLITISRRFRAWDPVHDAVFFAAAALIAAVGWQLNADSIAALLAR